MLIAGPQNRRDKVCDALFGSHRGDQHRGHGGARDSEFRSDDRSAVCHRGRLHAVVHDRDSLRRISARGPDAGLIRGDRDHEIQPARDHPHHRLPTAREGQPHLSMFVEDVTGTAPTCDRVSDIQAAHASCDDRIGHEPAQRGRPNQRPDVRLVTHLDQLERNSASTQRVGERASGVKGDQPHVMTLVAKAGQQDRPLSLGTSSAQVRPDEQGLVHAAQSSR